MPLRVNRARIFWQNPRRSRFRRAASYSRGSRASCGPLCLAESGGRGLCAPDGKGFVTEVCRRRPVPRARAVEALQVTFRSPSAPRRWRPASRDVRTVAGARSPGHPASPCRAMLCAPWRLRHHERLHERLLRTERARTRRVAESGRPRQVGLAAVRDTACSAAGARRRGIFLTGPASAVPSRQRGLRAQRPSRGRGTTRPCAS